MIKRILYHCCHDISTPDGPGTNEFEFTRVLADRFGSNAWCVIPKPASPVAHLDKMNIIHCSPLPRLRHLPGYLLKAWKIARRIHILCLNEQVDVICIRLSAFPVIPWLLQRIWKHPLALKTLGNWWPTDPSTSLLDALARRLFTMTTKGVIRRAQAIDTGLYEILEQLPELVDSPKRYCRIDNAADVHRFRPRKITSISNDDLTKSWPILGFIGSFPTARGAKEAVEVARRIQPDYPNVSVLVAGWDDDMDELVSLARSYGLENNCHFLGWVPYDKAPNIVASMTLGFSFYETWSLGRVGNASQKVRQYLACGKPVISVYSGHKFLQQYDLGTCVDHTDISQVEIAVRDWLKRLNTDELIAQRLRSYAVDNLSSEKAFKNRLNFWEKRFGC